jgi:hypothetical protein
MNPRRVRSSAWIIGLSAALAVVSPAAAQTIEDVREALDISPDPILRSPRLLGMGRLTLVNDRNNRINLWDFAGNPSGLLDADSTSVLEFRPATASASSVHNDLAGDPTRERQDLAARDVRMGFEAWRRAETVAYGFVGDVSSLRFDEPREVDLEQRTQFSQPAVTGVINGAIPLVMPDRLRFSVRMNYAGEDRRDQFRQFFHNGVGDYLDADGTIVPAPDPFTPDRLEVSTLGGGAGLAYHATPWLTAAVGGDFSFSKFKGENNGPRHATGAQENRPYTIGQASLIGRFGSALEWGADARVWNSASEQSWAISISTGSGATPFAGRGKYAEREEEGSRLRTRARWQLGALELGGALNTFYRQTTIDPPAGGDLTSFNYFRNTTVGNANADSLVFPDSVVHVVTEDRAWEGVGGASWQVRPGFTIGGEFHVYERTFDQSILGQGPVRKSWDARGGLEYPCTQVLTGRVGYVYRSGDQDDLTQQNEFVSQSVTVGAGLKPLGTTWSFEAGYAFEWLQPDYGDPTERREGRQQLAAQIRWVF